MLEYVQPVYDILRLRENEPMTHSDSRAPAHLRPLVGFGWRGFVAAAGLALLVALLFAGVDLQHGFLVLVDRTLGTDAVLWVVSHWMPFQGFALWNSSWCLALALPLVAALWIAPRRRAHWDVAVVLLLGLAGPTAYASLAQALPQIASDDLGMLRMMLAQAAINAVGVAALWLLTRCWWVAVGTVACACVAAASALGFLDWWPAALGPTGWVPWALLVVVPTCIWAIRARRGARTANAGGAGRADVTPEATPATP
jgi:hypothetical protein